MAGHGTLTTGGDAQGDCTCYVSSNGGNGNYPQNETSEVHNDTGKTLSEGDVVILDWDSTNGRISATSKGQKATGNVDGSGTSIEITNGGDTGMDGTINISNEYGNNGGFGGEEGVQCGCVNGEASYLC